MAMPKRPAGMRTHPRTGKSIYRMHISDVFEKIEEVAGYRTFPYKLYTLNNNSVYIREIKSLADVERYRNSIIKALATHKKLKTVRTATNEKKS